jgi:predicted ATPase
VYFVSLAGISSPDFLVSTVAEALHFTFYDHVEPRRQLLDYLREKELLLVLDNFEHLLPPAEEGKPDGAELVTDILAAAPAVKILITSRQALELREEWFHPLRGMEVPADNGSGDAEVAALEEYGAIQLFVQCARRAGLLAGGREGGSATDL